MEILSDFFIAHKEDFSNRRPWSIGTISFLTLLLLPFFLPAQSPYTGGKGDGYAKAELSLLQVSTQPYLQSAVRIFPQPIIQGQMMEISWGDPSLTLEAIQWVDINGSIQTLRLPPKIQEQRLSLLLETLSPGIYGLILQFNQAQYQSKILIFPSN